LPVTDAGPDLTQIVESQRLGRNSLRPRTAMSMSSSRSRDKRLSGDESVISSTTVYSFTSDSDLERKGLVEALVERVVACKRGVSGLCSPNRRCSFSRDTNSLISVRRNCSSYSLGESQH